MITSATIVLDRDGVINYDKEEHIKSPQEWKPIPGAAKAIAELNKAGYRVAIATNQSGLGRGLFDTETLYQIHAKLNLVVGGAGGEIELITYCPHHPNENCLCRKPNTGLLEAIDKELGLCPDRSWIVGDTAKDVLLGKRMGIRSALVLTGKGQRTIDDGLVSCRETAVFPCLSGFVSWLLDI